jgi:hypothetical protein
VGQNSGIITAFSSLIFFKVKVGRAAPPNGQIVPGFKFSTNGVPNGHEFWKFFMNFSRKETIMTSVCVFLMEIPFFGQLLSGLIFFKPWRM